MSIANFKADSPQAGERRMTTDQDSKMIEELVNRIAQAKGQRRTGQDERRTNTVRKLRKTPVKTTKNTAIGELVPQPHGGALRRGNPGNRGGGRPSHAVKQALCGDLEIAHQRIRSLLYDPSLRFTDLLDLYGELLDRLERYGF